MNEDNAGSAAPIPYNTMVLVLHDGYSVVAVVHAGEAAFRSQFGAPPTHAYFHVDDTDGLPAEWFGMKFHTLAAARKGQVILTTDPPARNL